MQQKQLRLLIYPQYQKVYRFKELNTNIRYSTAYYIYIYIYIHTYILDRETSAQHAAEIVEAADLPLVPESLQYIRLDSLLF